MSAKKPTDTDLLDWMERSKYTAYHWAERWRVGLGPDSIHKRRRTLRAAIRAAMKEASRGK